ncbi:MAG: glycosyltransferase family 4 protein [Bacteroidetes bacterium]|nr:glycosyltransferase family 4 protein [Bacteroidota bacterium]
MKNNNKSKNILLLTNIYPLFDKFVSFGTPVCHYFAKEWVKLGYNVKVIHTQAVYPHFFYLFAKLARGFIEAKTGGIVYKKREKDIFIGNYDGVEIERIPLLKYVPHGKFSKKHIKRTLNNVIKKNAEQNFVPDYIIGHFTNPMLEMVDYLKEIYNNKPVSCIVLHSNGSEIKKIYSSNYDSLMSKIDIWGFRSKTIKNSFENIYGKQDNDFLCYSGIPSDYVDTNLITKNDKIKKFCYVGSLIERKRVDTIIKALNESFPKKDFEFSIVGRGQCEKKLKKLVNKFELTDQVHFLGRKSREDVTSLMRSSDCFIMLSVNEVFGLVYLEAMGQGCITIGSKGEGIDGIINDGNNGFLCDPNNLKDIKFTLKRVMSLSLEDRKELRYNSINTAKNLTDKKVAISYVNNLENVRKTKKV